MKTFNALILLAGLLLAQASPAAPLPYYIDAELRPWWAEEMPGVDSAHHVQPFELLDQDSRPHGHDGLSGRINVVNFFFTSCPGICPTAMKNLQRASPELAALNVQMISLSVTPVMDTPGRLKQYAQGYGINQDHWRLLSGDPQVIDALARDSFFALQTRNAQADATVHTEKVFLLDTEARIRGVYNATSPADLMRLVEDARLLAGG